jgi:hypothetical protein
MIKAGRWNKADVYAIEHDGKQLVVKDFRAKPLYTRLIGRAQIAHECRAYEWLGDTPGIPRFHGRIDHLALMVERVDGSELVDSTTRFSDRRAGLHSLRKVIDRFRARGFFHLDVRGRHNVMVDSRGQVMLLDLAGSWWVDPDGPAYRLLRPCLDAFYYRVLNKWRKLLTPGRSFRDEKSALSKVLMKIRMPHKIRGKRRRY